MNNFIPLTPALSPMWRGRVRKRAYSGFSLIEILVAFSITAVALGIILQIYAKGTTSAILGEEYAQAVAVAESRLDELGTIRDLDGAGGSGTELDKYHWTIQIEDYVPEDPSAFESRMELVTVAVKVSWQSRGKRRSITLHSLKPYYPS